MTLRRITQAVAVGAALIGWVSLTAYSDYHWAAAKEREKSSGGWVVAAKSDNLIDLTRPWTIVKQPINSLWFVRPNEMVAVSADVLFVPTLSVRQEEDSVLGFESLSRELVNCSNRTDTYIEDQDTTDHLDWTKLQWHKFDAGTPAAQLIDFVCLHGVDALEARKHEPPLGGKETSILLMTSSTWDGFDKDQRGLYVKGFLETVSFIMYGYVPQNSETAKDFSDWTACAQHEQPSRWMPLDWLFGDLNRTAASQFFRIAHTVCEKDLGKGDKTWTPVRLVSKADWSSLSRADREIYVTAYIETTYEMLKRGQQLDQVREIEKCVKRRELEGIMKEVDKIAVEWQYPLPWSVSRGLGNACREFHTPRLNLTK